MLDAYLLDTTVASRAWDAGNPHHKFIRQELAKLDQNSISVCAITLGEVEYGLQINQGMDGARRNAVRNAMRQYNIFSIDQHTVEYYGLIRAKLFETYASVPKRGRISKKRPEELTEKTTGKELGIQENDL